MLFDEDDRPIPQVQSKPKIICRPKLVVDHSEARATYEQYLVKSAELKLYQEYARLIAVATNGPSMTPVRPLATFGTDNGPLRCDQCLMPIILEGGAFHGVYADDAWKRASDAQKEGKWHCYIKGGMVVQIVENGTLRIYHGYPRNPKDCCTLGDRDLAEREANFKRDNSKLMPMSKFLEAEFPHLELTERNKILTEVVKVMFSFDPGLGVNKPC